MGAIFKAEHDCAAAKAAYQRAVSLSYFRAATRSSIGTPAKKSIWLSSDSSRCSLSASEAR